MKPRTSVKPLLVALVIASAGSPLAKAQNNVTIPDYSFEKTVIAFGGATGNDNVGTNWSASQGNGATFLQNMTNTLFTATSTNTLPPTGDGTNYLVEQLTISGSGNAAYCWQDIGPLQSNTTYTLTIAVGQSLIGTTGQGFIGLVNGSIPFQTLLASTPVDNSAQAPGTFVDSSVVFTTGYAVSGHLTIVMELTNGTQILFDNVRLSTNLAPNPTALPPTFSSASSTVYTGSVVTLGEVPAGTSPFTYQWRSDNGTGGATFTSIPLATNASYTVTNTSVSTVQYEVIVTNSLGSSSTSAPVTMTVIQGPPVIVQDTLPALTPADVVGSAVTFSVVFDGDRPLTYQWLADYGFGASTITGTSANGTTNSTLILTNLQLSDSAYYICVVNNDRTGGSGTSSTPTFFTVNPTPAPDSFGVIISPANQYGLGGQSYFTPTWTVATNSLIAGLLPTTTSAGNFRLLGVGGTNRLTDGTFGTLYPQGTASPDLTSAGNPTSGAGSYVTYALPASANGWDITNIVVYGGWSDGGRDQQSYNILYSTIAAPTNFNSQLTQVNYLPSPNDAATPPDQAATRITLTSTNTNGVLLHNVAAIEFFFGLQNAANPVNENGWEGYAELQVFGSISAPAPVWVTNMVPATATDVTGSSVTMYCVANSGQPLTYKWSAAYTDGHGTGAITGTAPAGTTNSSLTLVNLQQSDAGTYTLSATNITGQLTSLPCVLTVNFAPGQDGFGVIDSPASQTGNSAILAPTWTVAPGSLIAGKLPSALAGNNGPGSFQLETASNGVPVLTDGSVGFVGAGNDIAMVTAGSSAGQSVTYTLTGSQNGYDLTNIQIFGGWTDDGRDEQAYTISYSTVSAPTTFVVLTTYDNPPLTGGAPNMTRMTYTTGTTSPLAANVAKVMINFNVSTPRGNGGENGYQGYSEIDVYGSPSAAVTYGPYVASDTTPSLCRDVVGSQEIFTTSFVSSGPLTYQWQVDTGAGPQPVTGVRAAGANSPTLTLSNLQLSDSGSYNCVATSGTGLGTATSTTNNLLVIAAPPATNNILVLGALQAWSNTIAAPNFTPTWPVPTGSLIAGASPSAVGAGSFTKGANGGQVGGGVSVLTDGQPGTYGSFTDTTLATGGSSATSGQSVTYTLTGAANGYNLTKIITYGGWGDAGRDEQAYIFSYSTASAPTVFIPLCTNDYRPANPPISVPGEPNSSRVTTVTANGAPLAVNVAKVQFNFAGARGGANGTTAGGENGWEGYAELQLFGVASPPTLNFLGGNLVGTGGTPGAGYTCLTTTNVAAPLSTWTTNSQGTFDGTGSFSIPVPVNPSQPVRFFEIRVP